MRQLLTEEWLQVPSDIQVQIKARKIVAKGRKGEVSKDFSHIPCEIQMMKQNDKQRKGTWIRIRMWFGTYKGACSVRTLRSLIKNMFTGVHETFVYKMRLVHAHFPINAKIGPKNDSVEIKNFLGGAHIKKVNMQGGTTVKLSETVKDELIFEGVDNAMVSLMCAQVSQCCKIGTKDERKFLDGIYVSEKTVADAREE